MRRLRFDLDQMAASHFDGSGVDTTFAPPYDVEETQHLVIRISVPYDFGAANGLTRLNPIPHDHRAHLMWERGREELQRMLDGFDVEGEVRIVPADPVVELRWVRFPARYSIFAALFLGKDVVAEWGVEKRKVVVAEQFDVHAQAWPSSRLSEEWRIR